jgi:hypothetical protein
MRAFWAVLASLAPLSLAFTFGVLARLGRRMGEALHARSFYLFYWAAAAFCIVPVLGVWIAYAAGPGGFPNTPEISAVRFIVILFLLPVCVGVSLALFATLRYWKWVWPELRSMSEPPS